MKTSITEFPFTQRILIGDGAMGSELFNRGLNVDSPCELWNLESPDHVLSIHEAYVEAGCDFIQTNTFGGNPFRLEESGVAQRLEELNRSAVELARQAAGERVWVLGCLGPSGHYLPPHGSASASTLLAGFERQARVLADAGIDAFLIETMMDLEELKCVFEAVRRVSDFPVLASMSFRKRGEVYQTLNGVDATQAACEMEALGAFAIGANCMYGIEEYPALITALRSGCSTPILAQPNAGQPRLKNGCAIYPATPDSMIEWTPRVLKAGANIVGGCCGTTPEWIRTLRTWVDRRNSDIPI